MGTTQSRKTALIGLASSLLLALSLALRPAHADTCDHEGCELQEWQPYVSCLSELHELFPADPYDTISFAGHNVAFHVKGAVATDVFIYPLDAKSDIAYPVTFKIANGGFEPAKRGGAISRQAVAYYSSADQISDKGNFSAFTGFSFTQSNLVPRGKRLASKLGIVSLKPDPENPGGLLVPIGELSDESNTALIGQLKHQIALSSQLFDELKKGFDAKSRSGRYYYWGFDETGTKIKAIYHKVNRCLAKVELQDVRSALWALEDKIKVARIPEP